jgi:hypothetical protein
MSVRDTGGSRVPFSGCPARARRFTAVVALLGAIGVLAACSDSEMEEVTLPETPVLAGRGSYVLIIEPFVRMHGRPAADGPVVSHAREGEVLEVVSVTADETWVEAAGSRRQGWVFAESVRVFAAREQALNARRARQP